MKVEFKPSSIVTVTRDVDHGDWKTRSVFPERWPTLKKGTKVKVISEFNNFYGRYITVEGPNGSRYDIEARDLSAWEV